MDHNLRLAPAKAVVPSPALASSLDVFVPLVGSGVKREITGLKVASSIDIAAHATQYLDGVIFKSDATTEAGLLAVIGTRQVETATVAGTIGAGGVGNVSVIITAAVLGEDSPYEVAVAVANDDTAAQVAGKIRTALQGDATVVAAFEVSGATDEVILTAIDAAADDATLNIATDNDTSTGLTAAPTSANTTAGVAPVSANILASFSTHTNQTDDAAFDKGIGQTLTVSSSYATSFPTTTATPDGTAASLPLKRTFVKQLDADETLYAHLVVTATSPAEGARLYFDADYVEGTSQTW
jgi:hypothetical protein